MKAIKYITIAMSLFGAVSAQAAVIPAGGFGVNSNFIDNGIITTEYRADGTVWEWLDLTVTNDISFNSVVDDLNDDNTLNNSNSSTLYASNGAKADVLALSAAQATGWNTVSSADVVDMLNSFFGMSLSVGQDISAPTSPLDDSSAVEKFITLYGDTFHDMEDDRNIIGTDDNPSLDNIGYLYGQTNTPGGSNPPLVFATFVFDGQYYHDISDTRTDRLETSVRLDSSNRYGNVGTWLSREVSTVSEPATAVMFTLGLMGVFARCRRS